MDTAEVRILASEGSYSLGEASCDALNTKVKQLHFCGTVSRNTREGEY
jgi:hypothetical protein